MKNFFNKFKNHLPFYKEKILSSIDILLVYQGILFVLSPTGVNQLLLIGLIIVFILLMMKKI